MIQISLEDITKLTELALFEVMEDEKFQLQKSINNILGYVSMVANADLSNLENSYHFTNITKDDEVIRDIGSRDLIIKNVRQVSSEGFVEVSKVINK